jgi:hypothetical protein
MTDDLDKAVRRALASPNYQPERNWFRALVGLLAVVGGLGSLIMLSFHAVPEGNREPLLLAIGMVLQWGAAVVHSEFGSSPGGRAAARAFVKERETHHED